MSIIAPMSANDIAISQAMERELILDSAREQAVGGDSWTVKRAPGSGRTSRPVEAPVGTVTGSVYRSSEMIVSGTSATFVPVDEWRFVADGSPDLLEGDTIVSVADSTLSFTVRSVEQRAGYIMAIVDQP